jgi:hypothetical protein
MMAASLGIITLEAKTGGAAMNRKPDKGASCILRLPAVLALAAGLALGAHARADDKPAASKHQLMKECMAKQKASEAGRSREEMKKTCEDLAKTEKQNADQAEKTNSR